MFSCSQFNIVYTGIYAAHDTPLFNKKFKKKMNISALNLRKMSTPRRDIFNMWFVHFLMIKMWYHNNQWDTRGGCRHTSERFGDY